MGNGSDFAGTEIRYFRNALKVLDLAVDRWKGEGITVVVNLGDVIDGTNSKQGQGASDAALQSIWRSFRRGGYDGENRIDCLGNHEFYNFPRDELVAKGFSC